MKPDEGAGGFKENVEDPEQEGGKAAGVHIFLQSHHPVSAAIQCGDVGGYSLHCMGPGGFPRPGGVATDGESAMAEVGRKVGVHLGGGGEIGGGVRANGNLHLAKT